MSLLLEPVVKDELLLLLLLLLLSAAVFVAASAALSVLSLGLALDILDRFLLVDVVGVADVADPVDDGTCLLVRLKSHRLACLSTEKTVQVNFIIQMNTITKLKLTCSII